MNLFEQSQNNEFYRLSGILKPENRIYPGDELWSLDSNEEKYFVWWLEEMVSQGFVLEYYQLKAFELIPSLNINHYNAFTAKYKKVSLAQSLTYHPDFVITWTRKANRLVTMPTVDTSYVSPFYHSNIHASRIDLMTSIVDVKPSGFGSHIASSRDFPIKQKLMLGMGLYVQKIMLFPTRKQALKIRDMKNPNNQISKYLFWRTFTPKKFMFTEKKHDPRKMHHDVYTIEKWAERYDKYLVDSYNPVYFKSKSVHL